MGKMKIGLYGGSFNPVHNAHVFVVESILKRNLVDEIWIIPCKDHPFAKDLAPLEKRFRMLELAFQNFENVKISDVENKIPGKSYTLDTIKFLKKNNPNDEFYFIIGTDILYEFKKWHNYPNLLKEIKFIIHSRPGFEFKKIPEMDFIFINESESLSSTKVRELVKKGLSISNIVPNEVERYIYKNHLYKN